VEFKLLKQLTDLEQSLAEPLLVTDEALSLGMQAGVLAQKLQAATADVGAFEWLVRLGDPNDPESILSVDYESLYAVLFAGVQSKLSAQAARLTALEAAGVVRTSTRKAV
jgi:hypothetical protein